VWGRPADLKSFDFHVDEDGLGRREGGSTEEEDVGCPLCSWLGTEVLANTR
jgi:hypothetical protein